MAAHDITLSSPTYGSFAADTILVEEETLTGIMSEPVKTFGKWRHTIGLLVLAFVVLLWTGTNFLASAILADHSFSKPYFVTYVNTSFFIIPMVPTLLYKAYHNPAELRAYVGRSRAWLRGSRSNARYVLHKQRNSVDETSRERLLEDSLTIQVDSKGQLSIAETARLSLQFGFLWFMASYCLLTCLENTTVASSTILTATASVFTLIFGTLAGIETLTSRKLAGVIASLAGVMLIASVDYSGKSSDEEHRGNFPEKSRWELVLGNTLGLLSAVIYGLYTVLMKKRIPDENRVNVQIFFGFVGLINVLCFWPGFFILHYTGIETFELPAPGRVTTILLLNALGSATSDIAWAYAVLLTSPILVTVGLSLNIPLSLVGQMVLNEQTSTGLYWLGAVIVLLSFIAVN